MNIHLQHLRFPRGAQLGLALMSASLLSAADGTIDLSAGTQFIGSVMGALQGWFPWALFCGFIGCLIAAAFAARRRMEWLGGAVICVLLALVYVVGRAYITKQTGTSFA